MPADGAEEPEIEVFYTFTWAARANRRRGAGRPEGQEARGNPGVARSRRDKGAAKGKGGKPDERGAIQARPPRKEKPIDPDNPFAAARWGSRTEQVGLDGPARPLNCGWTSGCGTRGSSRPGRLPPPSVSGRHVRRERQQDRHKPAQRGRARRCADLCQGRAHSRDPRSKRWARAAVRHPRRRRFTRTSIRPSLMMRKTFLGKPAIRGKRSPDQRDRGSLDLSRVPTLNDRGPLV